MVGNGLGEDDLEGGVKRVGKSWGEEIGFVGRWFGQLVGFWGALIFQLVSKKTT